MIKLLSTILILTGASADMGMMDMTGWETVAFDKQNVTVGDNNHIFEWYVKAKYDDHFHSQNDIVYEFHGNCYFLN